MNPPVRDAAHTRRYLAWRRAGRRRRSWLGSRAAHARGKGKALSGEPFRHDRRADAGADHARPRQRRPFVARAVGRSDQRRSGAAVQHRATRAASLSATTPTSRWSISSAGRELPTNGSHHGPAGRRIDGSSRHGMASRNSGARPQGDVGRNSGDCPRRASACGSSKRCQHRANAVFPSRKLAKSRCGLKTPAECLHA